MKSKISVIATVALCISSYANAQTIEKGSTLIGGGLNLGGSKYYTQNNYGSDSGKSNGTNFNIALGKAVRDNSIAGASLLYGFSKSKSLKVSGTESTSNNYGINFFYRRFFEMGNKFYFWAQPAVGFYFSDSKTLNPNQKNYSKSMNTGIYLTPGFSYNVYKKLYLDIALNNIASLTYNASESPGVKQNGFGFNSSLSAGRLGDLGMGFNFIF